jgi:beta-glucanase (GH16 family)
MTTVSGSASVGGVNYPVSANITLPTTTGGGTSPNGIPGNWTLAFDDEFTGTSLDTSKWFVESGTQEGVQSNASNIIMQNPGVALQLANSNSGVQMLTASYTLPVGGCCEAKIWFPGPGSSPGNSIYNWPAWWTSGSNWPAGGEIDIAEGGGSLTCNYHSSSGANNGPDPGPSGNWSNSWHTYGMLRTSSLVSWYYDGTVVRTLRPNDNGAGHNLFLDVGAGNQSAYGSASLVKVAYVRAWT